MTDLIIRHRDEVPGARDEYAICDGSRPLLFAPTLADARDLFQVLAAGETERAAA